MYKYVCVFIYIHNHLHDNALIGSILLQNSKELYFIYGFVLYGFEVRKVTHGMNGMFMVKVSLV